MRGTDRAFIATRVGFTRRVPSADPAATPCPVLTYRISCAPANTMSGTDPANGGISEKSLYYKEGGTWPEIPCFRPGE
eukprot:2199197-Rhodomonas_salina.4